MNSSNKENITKDFDNKKLTYFEKNYSNKAKNTLRRIRLSKINSNIDIKRKYNKVLDVGCGTAILYKELLNIANEYHALDLVQSNLDNIGLNNINKDNIKFIHCDIDSYNTTDKFDLIICSGSLEYSVEPLQNLSKLLTYLNKNGVFIASFPNRNNLYRIWSEYVYKYLSIIINILKGKIIFRYKRNLFTQKQIKSTLKEFQFQSVKFDYFGLKIILQPFDKLFKHVDDKFIHLGEKHKLFKLFYSEIILICRF